MTAPHLTYEEALALPEGTRVEFHSMIESRGYRPAAFLRVHDEHRATLRWAPYGKVMETEVHPIAFDRIRCVVPTHQAQLTAILLGVRR